MHALDIRHRDFFHTFAIIGNESEPKITINNTMNLFFNCNQHFPNFKAITASECCLIKSLPYILFEKYSYILAG